MFYHAFALFPHRFHCSSTVSTVLFNSTKSSIIGSGRLKEVKRCESGVIAVFPVFYVFYVLHRVVPCIVGTLEIKNNIKQWKRCYSCFMLHRVLMLKRPGPTFYRSTRIHPVYTHPGYTPPIPHGGLPGLELTGAATVLKRRSRHEEEGLILISHEPMRVRTVKHTVIYDAAVRFKSYSSTLTNKEAPFVTFC